MLLAKIPVGLSVRIRCADPMLARPAVVVWSWVVIREQTHEFALSDRIHVGVLEHHIGGALRAQLLRHHERNFAERKHLCRQTVMRVAAKTNAVSFGLIEAKAAYRDPISASCRTHAWF